VSNPEIKRLYYSISEACKLTGIDASVLRYWETEFKQLTPRKNRHNHRQYRDSDIQMVLKIKDLLWIQKYTIEGARQRLAREADNSALRGTEPGEIRRTLRESREIAQELKRLLES